MRAITALALWDGAAVFWNRDLELIFWKIFCYNFRKLWRRDMTLLEQIATLASEGTPREEIAEQVGLDRRTLDWLMDADSFLAIQEKVGGGNAHRG